MKLKYLSAAAALGLLAPLQSQAATTIFADNFDNPTIPATGNDGTGAGGFTKAWNITGTLYGGAGSETNAAQPTGSGHVANWAFFQTNGTNGSGINIDTGVATVANQAYTFSFLTGSKNVQLYTGTMTAYLYDWDGVGTLATDGTLIGSFVGANNAVSAITANSSSFTSAVTTEGNVYVRFGLTANAGGFAQPLLDNVLVTIPEPSAALLGGLGLLGLLRRRRA